MIQNYITLALRNLRKNGSFTFINIIGLSLGMTAFILIFQYICFEKSVNGFHVNLPYLHRVLLEKTDNEVSDGVAAGLPGLVKQRVGEVKDYCRIAEGSNLGNGVIGIGDPSTPTQSFREDKFAYAEGNFFQLFSFEIQEGVNSSLQKPNTVAISASTAKKYFGNESAIGKVISLNNQFGKTLYTVSILYKDMPENSDFQYDLIFSIQTLANKANLNGNEVWASLDGLNSRWLTCYMLLESASNISVIESKLSNILHQVNPESTELVRLQPLAYQHIASSLGDPFPTTGSLGFIYLLSGIAILILVIGWFNYINLSTATSLKRAKEVGIRKVSGATRSQLVRQFLGESILLNAIAFFMALAFVNLLQNSYNFFIGKSLSYDVFKTTNLWIVGILFIFLGSIISGAYTSFSLTSINPSQILKGIYSKSVEGIWVRKSLVVIQFSISIFLIACTLILQNQLHFLQNENLGMKLNQLLIINGAEVGKDDTFKERNVGFENELARLSFIENFSRSYSVPIDGYNYSTPGITSQNPLPGDEKKIYAIAYIDHRYFNTYSIPIVAGGNFPEAAASSESENRNKVIINERAVRELGFASNEDAIGEKIKMDDREYELIGVVKDYHHLSLRQAIDPILFFSRYHGNFYTAKVSTKNMAEQMDILNTLFKKYFPGNPFDYYFLDDKYDQLYRAEQQYTLLFSLASGLAIFIACLGLFGLAAFTVEQRVKEIGIRKVLGASISQITLLLSKDFMVLVFVAFLIATPLAWYAMHQWLLDFAYRTEISWWIFGIAGGIAVLIASITVSSQSIKAAHSNPVNSLRSE